MYVHSLVVVLLAFASPYFSRALASAQTSPDKTFGDQCYEGAAFGYDGASKDTSRGRARLAGSTTNLYTFEDRVGTTANRRNQSSAAGSLPTVDGPLHATRGGTEVVQRAMSRAELAATQETGLLRGGRAGTHFASDAVNSSAGRAQQRLGLPVRPEVRATLEVPAGRFSAPTRVQPFETPGGGVLPGGGMERTATGNIPARVLRVDGL